MDKPKIVKHKFTKKLPMSREAPIPKPRPFDKKPVHKSIHDTIWNQIKTLVQDFEKEKKN